MMDKTELVGRIKKAFRDVKNPGRKIGDRWELKDWINKDWQDVSRDDIYKNPTLIFLSHEGVLYYLRSYLLLVIGDSSHSLIREALIRDLGKYDAIPPLAKMRLCESFTQEQKQVVLDFLVHYEELFPFQSKNELKQLSGAAYRLVEGKISEQRQLIRQAIEYWDNCT